MSLIEHLFERAQKQPNHVIFEIFKDDEHTVLDLGTAMHKAANLAKVMVNKGGQKCNVLLAVDQAEDYIIGILACMIANTNIVLFPYYQHMPHDMMQQIVQRLSVRLILSHHRSGSITNTAWIHIGKATEFNLNEPLPAVEDKESLITLYNPHTDALNNFTLGQCIQSCRSISQHFGIEQFKNSGICWSPLYQHLGFFYGFLLPLCLDSRMLLLHEYDLDVNPCHWLELINQYRLGYCIADNAGLLRSASYITPTEITKLDLSSLKTLLIFDKPIKQSVMDHFINTFSKANFDAKSIFPAYDNPESAFMLAVKKPKHPSSKLYVDKYAINAGIVKTIAMDSPNAMLLYGRGQALTGNEFQIIDLHTQQPTAAMNIGEVYFSGQAVAYSSSSKDKNQAFVASGDLGFMDDRGELYLIGKVSDHLQLGAHSFNKRVFFSELIKENTSLSMHHFAYITAINEAQMNLILAFESELGPRELNNIFTNIITVIQRFYNAANVKIAVFNPGSIPRKADHSFDEATLEANWKHNEVVPRAMWEIDASKSDILGERNALIHLQGLSNEKVVEIFGHWLRAWLAFRAQTPESQIDFGQHLTSLGFDFQDTVELAREIDITFGQWFSPAHIWEFPNINAVAHFLFSDSHQDEDRIPGLNALKAHNTGVLSQQESWLFAVSNNNPETQNLQALRYIELEGPLDIDLLEETLNIVTQRHGSLRTCYHQNYDTPERYVSSKAKVNFKYVDILDIESAEEQKERLQQLLNEFEQQTFTLNQAPLWQVFLVRQRKDFFGLAIKCHHLIADSWGLSMLLQEIVQVYDSLFHHRQAPPLKTIYQYDDFACWQDYCAQENFFESQHHYWQQRLGTMTLLNLPIAKDSNHDHQAHSLNFVIDEQIVSGLRQLAMQNNSSLYTVYITAYQLLLAWFSGQYQVAFKAKHFNRQRQFSADIIGNFESGYIISDQIHLKTYATDLLSLNQDRLSRHYRNIDISYQEILALVPQDLQGLMPNCEFTFHRHPSFGQMANLNVINTYNAFARNRMPNSQAMIIMHHYQSEARTHGILQLAAAAFHPSLMHAVHKKYEDILTDLVHNAGLTVKQLIGKTYK